MEPFGLVLVEAQASGCPVIAINNGAVAEVVNHGETGFVVQCPDDMAEVIKSGLIDEINPIDCRRWVEERFSRQVMARNYLKLYQDVLEDRCW
jgi:glycosyltransferase involved in cell wall biosynthesis